MYRQISLFIPFVTNLSICSREPHVRRVLGRGGMLRKTRLRNAPAISLTIVISLLFTVLVASLHRHGYIHFSNTCPTETKAILLEAVSSRSIAGSDQIFEDYDPMEIALHAAQRDSETIFGRRFFEVGSPATGRRAMSRGLTKYRRSPYRTQALEHG